MSRKKNSTETKAGKFTSLKTPADLLAQAWVAMTIEENRYYDGEYDNDENNFGPETEGVYFAWHDAACKILDMDKPGILELASRRAEALLLKADHEASYERSSFMNSLTLIACEHPADKKEPDRLTPEIFTVPFVGDATIATDILNELSDNTESGWKTSLRAIMAPEEAIKIGPTECWRFINREMGLPHNPCSFPLLHDGFHMPAFAILVMAPIVPDANYDAESKLAEMVSELPQTDIIWMEPIGPYEIRDYLQDRRKISPEEEKEFIDYATMAVREGGYGTHAMVLPVKGNKGYAEVQMVTEKGTVLDSRIFFCSGVGITVLTNILNKEGIRALVRQEEEHATQSVLSEAVSQVLRQGLQVIPEGRDS